MKYLQATFHINGTNITPELMATASDIVSGLASEAGFESFNEEEGSLTGYVQEDLFNRELLDALLADFPIPNISVGYDLEKAEYRDWNAAWEEEGFEPIDIDGLCIIHDKKHPVTVGEGQTEVVIDARMAFGTGTHETTQMMVDRLLHTDLKDKRVLDCGCGTGILSIVASKAGASSVVAYDIDEWSVDNTLHNAQLNEADNIEVLTGDIHVLSHISGVFDIVMANINRNILLADMPSMCEVLAVGGTLMLSGFYESDVAALTEEAERLGLILQSKSSIGDWVSLSFLSK
jgi:ribosomal protein L11 methyltransferase